MKSKNCEIGNCSLDQEEIDFIKTFNNTAKVEQNKTSIKIKLFGKNSCDVCKKTFEKLEQYLVQFENKPVIIYYDLDTLDGLTEAARYIAFDIPTIVIEKNGCEIVRWKGLPSDEELKSLNPD